MKYGKKMMAAILSAAMVASMSMSAFAAPQQGDITAPILSFDKVDVVVPTTYAMVFNPEERNVTVDSATSTDQILARSFGILNKSSKDKVVTVELTVDSQNDGKVTFVEDEASVSDNSLGDYRIYLAAIPADGTEVKVNPTTPAAADKDTTGAALSKAVMTGADAQKVAMKEGKNTLAFKLEKATYGVNGTLDLDSVSQNSIADKMQITGVAANGGGITAFTFGGAMDENADWHLLQDQIKITATYDIKAVTGEEVAVAGTGAMIEADAARITISATGLMTVEGLTAAIYSGGVVTLEGTDYTIDRTSGNWVETETAPATYQFSPSWTNNIKGNTVTVKITLTDGTIINEEVAVPAN